MSNLLEEMTLGALKNLNAQLAKHLAEQGIEPTYENIERYKKLHNFQCVRNEENGGVKFTMSYIPKEGKELQDALAVVG